MNADNKARGATVDLVFDHLGVVVKSIDRGRKVLSEILNIEEWTTTFEDHVNGVFIQFGRDATGICYELLEPLDANSPVYPALSSRRTILNHVAYRATNLAGAAGYRRLWRIDAIAAAPAKP